MTYLNIAGYTSRHQVILPAQRKPGIRVIIGFEGIITGMQLHQS